MDKAMIEQAMQEAADAKMRKRAGKAYDRAMTNTPAAPMPAAPAARTARSPMVEESIQEAEDAKMRNKIRGMGYKSGGSISASRRGDGIAQRGKTKGRMI